MISNKSLCLHGGVDGLSIFLTGDLAQFEVMKTVKIQKRNHLRLDIEATSNRITEGMKHFPGGYRHLTFDVVIIGQTPMLEELSGNSKYLMSSHKNAR